MTIYRVFPNLGETNASLVFSQQFDDFEQYNFNGNKVTQWNPVKFQWNLDNDQKKSDLVFNDIVVVFGAGMDIAVNEKAKNVFSKAFKNNIEFLPIEVIDESEKWYLINVLNMVSAALDKNKSEYKIKKDGKQGRLIKPVFISNNIPDNSIFIFPEAPSTLMTKGSYFEEVIKENSLTGLSFSPS